MTGPWKRTWREHETEREIEHDDGNVEAVVGRAMRVPKTVYVGYVSWYRKEGYASWYRKEGYVSWYRKEGYVSWYSDTLTISGEA